MTILSIDLETFSATDLLTCGVEEYAKDPTCEILICEYAIDYGEPITWIPALTPMPNSLRVMLTDPEVKKTAFNVSFEQTVIKYVLGIVIPSNQLWDTMILARQCALPATLQKVSEVTNGAVKDKSGKALIRFFSILQKPTKKNPHYRNMPSDHPEKFEQFIQYCKDDVRAEMAVLKALGKYNIKQERPLYLLDQKINQRGIRFDMELVKAIDQHYTNAKTLATQQMKEKTDLDNPNSRNQLLGWLKTEGYGPNNLTAASVEKALTYPNGMSAMAIEVLKLRMLSNVSSAAKYKAVIRAAPDGLLKNSLTYYGASRTGRWAGRTYQPQNLPRPDYKIQDKLEEAIEDTKTLDTKTLIRKYDLVDLTRTLTRPIVKADEGKMFAVADLSSIESVVLGWIASEPAIIETFRAGKCAYKTFATDVFNVKYEDVTKDQRTQSKPAVLGCGYRLGPGGWSKNKKGEDVATGLFGYAQAFNVDLGLDECERMVGLWRAKHPNVVQFWYDIENAVRKTIVTKKEVQVNRYISTRLKGPFLEIVLPSGRPLRYFRPKIVPHTTPWGETKPTISYLSPQYGMVRDYTHGGKLTENCFVGGTLIATSKGPKRIDNITTEDFIWDGVEYVKSRGAKLMGTKEVVEFNGVMVTPDHKILTEEGWRSVEEIQTTPEVHRLQQSSYGWVRESRVPRVRGGEAKSALGTYVRVWRSVRDTLFRLTKTHKTGEAHNLQGVFVQRYEREAQHDRTPRVLGLALNESPLWKPKSQGVQELRRAGHNSVRCMGELFSNLLGRHVRGVLEGASTRSGRQQLGVSEGQLPVGGTKSERPKQEEQRIRGNSLGLHNFGRGGGAERHRGNNPTLQDGARGAGGRTVRQAGCDEQVYDIMNCGPRNRFVVCGDVDFIAHNCIQAVARDILAEGLTNADKIGMDIVMHVHDEIICQVPEGMKDFELGRLIGAMTKLPNWGDKDLILRADGYTCPRYVKD